MELCRRTDVIKALEDQTKEAHNDWKHNGNLCTRALRNGVRECNVKDLLTQSKYLSKALGIQDVTKDFHHKETSGRKMIKKEKH